MSPEENDSSFTPDLDSTGPERLSADEPVENEHVSDDAAAPFDARNHIGRYPTRFQFLNKPLRPFESTEASSDKPLPGVTIVVPAGRDETNIESSARLAKEAGCRLIALCSHDARFEKVADRLAAMGLQSWLVADIPPGFQQPLMKSISPSFIPEHARRKSPSNLSLKRNLGLAMCTMFSKEEDDERIFYCDDDIEVSKSSLHSAVRLSRYYETVGLRAAGFPDVAVVDHAEDVVVEHHMPTDGLKWHAYGHISGNSAVTRVNHSTFFCPEDIYGEDHLDLADKCALGQAAMASGDYVQKSFKPFTDPARARAEEFGETIVHGVYRRLERRDISSVRKTSFWDEIIAERTWLITSLLNGLEAPQNPDLFPPDATLPEFEPGVKARVSQSLEAALDVNSQITATACIEYFNAWKDDSFRWSAAIRALPRAVPVDEALDRLQLTTYASSEH